MNYDFAEIESLMHDATFASIDWPSNDIVDLFIHCLRRASDGSEIQDPIVQFRFSDVAALGLSFDTWDASVRPSLLSLPVAADVMASVNKSCGGAPISADFDSLDAVDSAIMGLGLSWLQGGEEAFRSCPRRIVVTLEGGWGQGDHRLDMSLMIGCGELEFLSSGQHLGIDRWASEFDAWWRGWDEYWDDKDEHEDDDDEYEAAIPVGESEPLDLNYQPPPENAFDLKSHDVPKELLSPIEGWIDGCHRRDWVRMARAWPWPNVEESERVKQLEEECLGYEFGRWIYVRVVDGWWIEGIRAAVTLRGVEHCMPMEGDPAENLEIVTNFALWKYRNQWVIRNRGGGYPKYGSSPKWSSGQGAWLHNWDSGPVE